VLIDSICYGGKPKNEKNVLPFTEEFSWNQMLCGKMGAANNEKGRKI